MTQSNQLITKLVEECGRKPHGGLNHSAAKNIRMKTWAGLDDKEVVWKEMKPILTLMLMKHSKMDMMVQDFYCYTFLYQFFLQACQI